MLREAKNVAFPRTLTLLGWRYRLTVGDQPAGASWRTRRLRALAAEQEERPVVLVRAGARTYWLFEGRCYWEDDDLEPADVLALVRDRERRARRRLERAHASLAAEALERPRREPIPREVRLAVFRRDGGRCAECGSGFDLQYDHVIPVALGGASTVQNLELLCGDCNRRKGASL